MDRCLAYPEESDHLSWCPWEGHNDSINNSDSRGNSNLSIGHTPRALHRAGGLRVSPRSASDSVVRRPRGVIGEGTHPKSQKVVDLGFEPARLARVLPSVLCCTRPLSGEAWTRGRARGWGKRPSGREMRSHVTLASGPLQPWRMPGALPALRLPGPAGGDAGCQLLQGSGPEGVGSLGPQGAGRGGRGHSRR